MKTKFSFYQSDHILTKLQNILLGKTDLKKFTYKIQREEKADFSCINNVSDFLCNHITYNIAETAISLGFLSC